NGRIRFLGALVVPRQREIPPRRACSSVGIAEMAGDEMRGLAQRPFPATEDALGNPLAPGPSVERGIPAERELDDPLTEGLPREDHAQGGARIDEHRAATARKSNRALHLLDEVGRGTLLGQQQVRPPVLGWIALA